MAGVMEGSEASGWEGREGGVRKGGEGREMEEDGRVRARVEKLLLYDVSDGSKLRNEWNREQGRKDKIQVMRGRERVCVMLRGASDVQGLEEGMQVGCARCLPVSSR